MNKMIENHIQEKWVHITLDSVTLRGDLSKIRSLRTPNPVLSERLFSNPFSAVSTLQKCSTLSQG
jgi:hypothetical protein